MTNIKNITKTILFASLIAAMILPFSMVDFAQADEGDKLKKDLELLIEAENIEKKEKDLKYDNNGKNKDGAKNKDQKRHEEIVKELNSRGIFHKS